MAEDSINTTVDSRSVLFQECKEPATTLTPQSVMDAWCKHDCAASVDARGRGEPVAGMAWLTTGKFIGAVTHAWLVTGGCCHCLIRL